MTSSHIEHSSGWCLVTKRYTDSVWQIIASDDNGPVAFYPTKDAAEKDARLWRHTYWKVQSCSCVISITAILDEGSLI